MPAGPSLEGIFALPSAITISQRFSVTADTLLEAWPVYDQDTGQHTWAFVRQFLHGNASDFRYLYVYPDTDIPAGNCEIAPKIPILYRPWIEDVIDREASLLKANRNITSYTRVTPTISILNLFMETAFGLGSWVCDLDFKPEQCLANSPFYKSWCWLDSASFKASDDGVVRPLIGSQRLTFQVCRAIPQPPRMDGYAFTVLINAIKVGVQWQISWPSNINWTSACNSVLPPEIHPPLTPSIQWPSDFAEVGCCAFISYSFSDTEKIFSFSLENGLPFSQSPDASQISHGRIGNSV